MKPCQRLLVFVSRLNVTLGACPHVYIFTLVIAMEVMAHCCIVIMLFENGI